MINLTFSIDDIDQQTAECAFNGTSFSPEKRGELRRREYVEHMTAVKVKFGQWVTADNAEEMNADLEVYKAEYISKLNDYLYAHSRVMSTMITGPANFPTNSNRKKSDTADRRMVELIEWSKKRLDKLERRYNPVMIAARPIMTGDSDALDRLRAKLVKLEKYQETMKEVNKIVRKKGFAERPYSEQVQAVKEATGWKNETIYEILKPYMGSIGFQGFTLANNSAEIRRLSGRITQLERLAQQETTSQERPDGITVERDPESARIRLIFPGKPDTETRKLLKSHGFRWAPSVGAWQRQLTSNGEYAANCVLAALAATGAIDGQ